jgi:AAA family ATP:ADP antiporter
MFFCILFNYTILRDTKDVLVVTAPGSGAEVIPFLKTWVNLPMAIGFMVLYSQLVNVLATETLFYVCIIPFITFFASFAFILYPMSDVLHPNAMCDRLLQEWGQRAMGPLSVLRNWTYCLFYVMAELWGSVVVSVLFWGFANQITSVDEAKQFYPLFGLGANVALIFSGRTVKVFSEIREKLPPGVDGWGYSLKGMMTIVASFGLAICAIYYYMQRTVVPKVEAKKAAGLMGVKPSKKKKEKMTVGESMGFLAKSPYIRDLACLVVAYGVCINLVEVTWKGKIKAQFPNPNEYSAFMGDFSSATGIVTFTMMIASRFIFKKFGWGGAAMITPTVLLITGVMFFALVMFGSFFEPITAALGYTPLMAAVLVGAAQNIFSKSSKYSLFDPCKEMAYIPLDSETQAKGKAAIDVVCNPLGKSGGALIQQFLIVTFGSLAASTPYLAVILFGFVGLWLMAARSLDKQFTALTVDDLKEKLASAKGEDGAGAVVVDAEDRDPAKSYKFVSVKNPETGEYESKYSLDEQ